jgi:hypothetical protein
LEIYIIEKFKVAKLKDEKIKNCKTESKKFKVATLKDEKKKLKIAKQRAENVKVGNLILENF